VDSIFFSEDFMAHATQDNEEMISGINVTPLVDITLVLLIIFMVTATYVVKESIEVDLPRAASGGETIGTSLMLVLDKQGKVYVDGHESSWQDVRRAVQEAATKDKNARVIISADKSLSHGKVVEIIDLVKSEGLLKFAINIEKETN
jgi:biopolymer transport protein ExbD